MTNKAPTNRAGSSATPVLRGLHHATIRRNLAFAFGVTALVAISFHYLVNAPKKVAYAEYYKNYDAQKSFERMRANGRFQSCPPK